MARVKGAVHRQKARKTTLKKAKGYRFGRSKKVRQAYEALVHAGAYAFAHRRDKKNDYRRLWQVRINAALDEKGISYSKFIDKLKKGGIAIDRKILAELAAESPDTFSRLVSKVIS